MTCDTLKILIVDDDAGDRKHIRRLLARCTLDAALDEQASIESARQRAADCSPDLILLDFLMPDTTGLDALDALRAARPEAAIVMITGQGDELVATEAIKRGASDYIPKRSLSETSLERVVGNAVSVNALRLKVAEQQAALENFAYILAHDLKAPLNTINMLAQMAEEDLSDGDTAALADDVQRIRSCAKRGAGLIDALTTHIRVGQDPEITQCDLGNLARQAVETLDFDIRESLAVVQVHDLPPALCCGAEVVQLFQNLIGNAIKYCDAQPPRVEVGYSTDDQRHHFYAVRDNGIGIPAERAREVFEPFKRLHSDSYYAGTGLGLATCHKIVDRLGGRIWCEPRQSGGTVFKFTLPAGHRERAAA